MRACPLPPLSSLPSSPAACVAAIPASQPDCRPAARAGSSLAPLSDQHRGRAPAAHGGGGAAAVRCCCAVDQLAEAEHAAQRRLHRGALAGANGWAAWGLGWSRRVLGGWVESLCAQFPAAAALAAEPLPTWRRPPCPTRIRHPLSASSLAGAGLQCDGREHRLPQHAGTLRDGSPGRAAGEGSWPCDSQLLLKASLPIAVRGRCRP